MTGRNKMSGVRAGIVVQAGAVHGDVHVHPHRRWQPPLQLRLGPPQLVDRHTERAELDQLARPGPAGRVTLVVISGPGGVGKSALALHCLHTVADRFSGGVLHAELGGWSTSGPLDPHLVVRRWLRALGVDGDQVPGDAAEAGALLRSLTARAPVAVLIEDVVCAAQVEPLLPGSGLVVVTSRDRLPGLYRHGAHFLPLAPLERPAAIELATALIGPRAEAEPGAVARLAEVCGGLPLALLAVGAHLATRPHRSISQVADAVTHAHVQRRMTALSKEISVHASLDASYQDLPEKLRRAYRLLAMHPGAEFDAAAAGALLATTITHAAGVLEELMTVSLLEHAGGDRFRWHALTAEHARQMAENHESALERRAAQARLLQYYLEAAAAADYRLLPSRQRLGGAYVLAQQHPPTLNASAAMDWLEVHITTLAAAQQTATEIGRHDLAWQLAETMWGWLQSRRDHTLWEQVCERAISSARTCAHPVAEARLTGLLTQALRDAGEAGRARELAESMPALAELSGDRMSEATAHELFAMIALDAGDPRTAIGELETSLGLLHQLGRRRRSTALIYRMLGAAYAATGRHADAAAAFDLAFTQFEEVGDVHQQGRTLTERAQAELDAGDPARAVETVGRALPLLAGADRPYSTAHALRILADAHHQAGHTTAARATIDRALTLYRDLGAADTHTGYAHARELANGLTAAGGDPR